MDANKLRAGFVEFYSNYLGFDVSACELAWGDYSPDWLNMLWVRWQGDMCAPTCSQCGQSFGIAHDHSGCSTELVRQ